MDLISYVDILEVVGDLKDFKTKLVEGEGIAMSNGLDELSITKRDGVFEISALCQPFDNSVNITVISEPRSLECKCSCTDDTLGKCKHVVATLIYLHRNSISLDTVPHRTGSETVEESGDFEDDSSQDLSQLSRNSVPRANRGHLLSQTSSPKVKAPRRGRLRTQVRGDARGRANILFSSLNSSPDDNDLTIPKDEPRDDLTFEPKTEVIDDGFSRRNQISTGSVMQHSSVMERDEVSVEVRNDERMDGNITMGITIGSSFGPSPCLNSSREDSRTGRGQRKKLPNPKYALDLQNFSCSICTKTFDKKTHYEEHVRSHTGEKPFRCDVCGQQFSQKRTLLKHKGDGGEKGCRATVTFACNFCDKGFDCQTLLDDHTLTHTNASNFQCPSCAKLFASQSEFNLHVSSHILDQPSNDVKNSENEERSFVCDVCGKGFKKNVHLKQHKITHANVKPFHCTKCGKDFSRQRTLNTHLQNNTNCSDSCKGATRSRPIIKCDTCGKEFTNRMHHEEHVRSHTGERPFQCVTCGKGFASKRSLRNHSHDGPSARSRPHVCTQCSASFATAFMLKTHERSHTDVKPWVCSECGKAYRSQHVFQDHQNQHRGIKAHKCKECGKAFTWRTSLWAHTREHAKEKPFECVQCGAMFGEQSELRDHWSIHLDDKPHQCPECGLGFMHENDRDQHVETHKKLPSFSCSQCDKKFIRADELNRHKQTHKEKQKSLCPNCGQSFSSKGHLKVHMLIHTGEKPFACETCGKRFYTRSLLRKHTVFHSSERPFECALCGDKFPTQGILRAHIRTHTGERPYSCKECGKSFPQSTYLKRHILTHSGAKPFPCSQCESAFVSRYDLKIHMRTHTGEKPFTCDDCGEKFYERAQLTSHRRMHTGEHPFMCDICVKGFNSSNHVKKHFGRVHPDIAPFPCPQCDERFMMCEALRKHKKCTHLSGIERVGRLVQLSPKADNVKESDMEEESTPKQRDRDTLNRLIEESEILIDDKTNSCDGGTSQATSEGIITQHIEFVEVPSIVDIVQTSQIQVKLSDFDCQTVQLFHAEPLSEFDANSQFQTVSITHLSDPITTCAQTDLSVHSDESLQGP